MGDFTSQHSIDTYVRADQPSRTGHQTNRLVIRKDEAYAYTYFPRPFPLGATIIDAKLTLRTYETAMTRAKTVSIRRTEERTTLSRLAWNNRPATVAAGQKTVTKSGAIPSGEAWVFDVTDHMQAVSDGADWLGWRVESDTTLSMWLYAARGGSRWRPELEIEWSDAPDDPTQLHPAGGRIVGTPKPVLRWDYTDVSGNTAMSGLQVQFATDEAMTAGVWDSGVVIASVPELRLADTTFPGVPDGGVRWWRVKVQDGAGLWSGWSDPVETKYVDKSGTFTLISPAPGGTGGTPAPIDDATPVVAWSLTGATQTAYRVRVAWNTTVFAQKNWLYDSGWVTSTDTSVTLPDRVLRYEDRTYKFQVDVRDTLDRVSTPGSIAAYQEGTIAFLDTDSIIEVDWLSVRALDPYPFVELEWDRSPAPDGWVIGRSVGHGAVRIATVEYADTLQPDGTHRFVDRYAPPNTEVKYFVRPVVNNKVGTGNPPQYVVSKPVGIWLVNDQDATCLQGVDEGTWAMGDTSVIHEPISGDRVVQIRSRLRGYEGSISGLLIGGVARMENVTAGEWRDAFLRIKRDGGAQLTANTEAFPVLIADAVAAPSPRVDERYAASFAFWQDGYYDWDAL